MTTTEMIYKKAQSLDATRLQELNDFLDFLLQKKQKPKEELFPVSKLETPDTSSPYTGKLLTIENMDDAISYEEKLRVHTKISSKQTTKQPKK